MRVLTLCLCLLMLSACSETKWLWPGLPQAPLTPTPETPFTGTTCRDLAEAYLVCRSERASCNADKALLRDYDLEMKAKQ